ncbi:MAG: rod shape-determining protein MreD [Candidatus Omnitrophica bacterium]|nr:rod shape-determining protein MreD [Candidatus Omnitrophota bacterium]
MLQIIIIPITCYLVLLLEFTLFNVFGRWGAPQLLLLVVIFFYLYSGIRYSLWAAFWAGGLKDCFTTLPFGANIFAFVLFAYLATVIRRYCYERGSDFSKLWMVLCVLTAHTIIMGILHIMTFEEIRWAEAWGSIWFPQTVMTLLVTIFVFERLRGVARALKF